MTPADFTQVLENRIEMTRYTLNKKAKEYAPGTDRLHNFRAASGLKGEPMAQAAWGMMVKHIVSIADMVQDPTEYSAPMWDEKIGDLINYAILIEACVIEEKAATMEKEVRDIKIPHTNVAENTGMVTDLGILPTERQEPGTR